ncbi:uncharacterized protein LOC129302012 [Prosopis cineraria]|uniref:uncharacterized protein LOC129302012 n=1 Tax=Prosopis cineraria TaxID=364024 RepID=UPI00240FACF3|nr:uncharacterized protein LOC129302012 [Prosopis cineraria]
MDSNGKHGSSDEYINLDGNNVGASMRVYQRSFKGEPKDCCCINIYINSNVQGVSNSVLHGSQVKMTEPGIRLYFDDLKVDGRTNITNNISRPGSWLYLLLLFAFLVFLFLLVSSTRIFIIII